MSRQKPLGSDILVRSIPSELRAKIEQERQKEGLSLREYLITLLDHHFDSDKKGRIMNNNQSSRIVKHFHQNAPFRYIDLFAGIGGFRTALDNLGGRCVFSSEWDKYSKKTYNAWYGEEPIGDIRQVDPSTIPDHDIMAAGFPCQPFSIAGVSKLQSLGRLHGFKDAAQGTLFFSVATIAEIKRPPVLFLENVKNLRSHDQGKTWKVIKKSLEELDYVVFDKIIDAAGWVPQHRERIFIVCFDIHRFGANPPFSFPEPPPPDAVKLRDILEDNPDPKYTLSDKLWEYLQEYALRHKARGNGFGFGLADPDGITRTLSARYYKDGSEILIPQKGRNPRRLTPYEAMLLMGFPPDRRIPVSDTQAYRQFGNAVVPKVVEAVGRKIIETLCWYLSDREQQCLVKS